jgi:hypothetical protein
MCLNKQLILSLQITSTGELLHEKVFGLFIENATPHDFLLIFGSGRVLNLNTEIHLPVVIDKSGGAEAYWVELQGIFTYFWLQNVDISNNIFGELDLNNVSSLFISNGLKECIYVYFNGNFTLIN